jgi:hypothetical protein
LTAVMMLPVGSAFAVNILTDVDRNRSSAHTLQCGRSRAMADDNQPSGRQRYAGDLHIAAATSPARLGAATRDQVGTLPKMGGGPSRDALPMATMAVPLFTGPANCPCQANLLNCDQAAPGPMAAEARHGVGASASRIRPPARSRCDAPCVLRHRRRMH